MASGKAGPRKGQLKALRNEALERLFAGTPDEGPSTLFLDFDDVLCLNAPYSGGALLLKERPHDLFHRIFHAPAADALLRVITDCRPRLVLTSSWVRFLTPALIDELFHSTGLQALAQALHPQWGAPPPVAGTRVEAITLWLTQHYSGGPVAVLDDEVSGSGLAGSALDRQGRVVLCKQNVGLHAGHVQRLIDALRQ